MTTSDDSFELYDLRVEVVCPSGKRILCGAKAGDYFELHGEMLYLPPGQGISVYSLSAVLPLLAAKQRRTHANDWMSSDALVACPDPNCPSMLKIVRAGTKDVQPRGNYYCRFGGKRAFGHLGWITIVGGKQSCEGRIVGSV